MVIKVKIFDNKSKLPFGRSEQEHNAFCDSLKDNNGSYKTFFKLLESAGKLKKLDDGIEN